MQPEQARAPVTVHVDFAGDALTVLNVLTAQTQLHQDALVHLAVSELWTQIGSAPAVREAQERLARKQLRQWIYAALAGFVAGAVLAGLVWA